MSRDYLPNTCLTLLQSDQMFRFNSDTVLLGEFMSVKKSDRVLDIGTNNGALLLYASCYSPKELVGIDIHPQAIELAKQNLLENNLEAKLIESSLQTFEDTPYDVIVCNPPYFNQKNTQLKNDNEYLRSARHEDYLTLEELFTHVKRLLKTNGRFYLVYPSDRLHEVMVKAYESNLALSELKLVFDENKEFSTRFLACFSSLPYKSVRISRSHTIRRIKKTKGHEVV